MAKNDKAIDDDMDVESETIFDFDEDISGVEAPPLLPVGTYVGTIEKAEAKVSGAGNTMAVVSIRVSPEEYPVNFSAEEEPNGVVFSYYRLLLRDAEGRATTRMKHNLRKWCEAIGSPMGTRLDLNDWVGRPVKVRVVHERYEGEPRAAMRGYEAVD